MALGITIQHADGHRWICSEETVNDFNFEEELESKSLYYTTKIYGGVLEALDVVDIGLNLTGRSSLLDYYGSMFDEETITYESNYKHNRIVR